MQSPSTARFKIWIRRRSIQDVLGTMHNILRTCSNKLASSPLPELLLPTSSRRDRSWTRIISPYPTPPHSVPRRKFAGRVDSVRSQGYPSAPGPCSGKRRRREDDPDLVKHKDLASDMGRLSVQPEKTPEALNHTVSSPQTRDKKRVRVEKQRVGRSVPGSSRQPSSVTVKNAALEIRFRKELIDLTDD